MRLDLVRVNVCVYDKKFSILFLILVFLIGVFIDGEIMLDIEEVMGMVWGYGYGVGLGYIVKVVLGVNWRLFIRLVGGKLVFVYFLLIILVWEEVTLGFGFYCLVKFL